MLDNITWPKVDLTDGNLDYVWLNYTLSQDINPDEENYQFYKDVFDRYGGDSYSTY